LKILIALILALHACACSGQKGLSAEDIKIQVGNVRTAAAAAQLLCESFIKGETTVTFFKTQASLLADKANTAASDLEGNAGNAEEARQRAQVLATELSSVCSTLSSDPNAAATTREQARSLARNASQLEDELKSSQ
jgi:hypothetical protein